MPAFYTVRQGLLEGLREALPVTDAGHSELTAAVLATMSPDAPEKWVAGERTFEGTELISDPPAPSGLGEGPCRRPGVCSGASLQAARKRRSLATGNPHASVDNPTLQAPSERETTTRATRAAYPLRC